MVQTGNIPYTINREHGLHVALSREIPPQDTRAGRAFFRFLLPVTCHIFNIQPSLRAIRRDSQAPIALIETSGKPLHNPVAVRRRDTWSA